MARIKSATGGDSGPPPIFAATASELTEYRAAKTELSRRFLTPRATARGAVAARAMAAISPVATSNVVGVGIGEKIVDGKPTGIRAIKLLVKLKLPEGQLDRKNLLPKSIDGLPVDVEQSGVIRRLARKKKKGGGTRVAPMPNPRGRFRPAQPGCSVGFEDPGGQFVMAGTFGAVVTDGADAFILSNNHVLADENRLAAGAPIFQPGLLDGGRPARDQVAELTRFEPLASGVMNKVDCAIARALRPPLLKRDILFIGPPRGSKPAEFDMVVHKFGRTTSYRVGRVTSLDTDVSVEYETGTFTFEGQIIIVGVDRQPFSDAGDSGSLILRRSTQHAIGLLFAGSTTHTIANHIADVLQAMNVTLA